MASSGEAFGRQTVLAATEILQRLGHAGLDRFLLTHGLENTKVGGGRSLLDRANSIATFLLQNPGALNEQGQSLRSAVIRDAVIVAVDALDPRADPRKAFGDTHPDLAESLKMDGFEVQQGQLYRVDELPIATELSPPSSGIWDRAASAMNERNESGAAGFLQDWRERRSINASPENNPIALVEVNELASEPDSQPSTDIRVFISHSSKDREFVRLLINLLRNALSLPAGQILCTSVDGYRLAAGASATEHLRREIRNAQAFIGIISAHSLQSLYVTFEWGARWGAGKHLIPLLAPGVPPSVLAAPLNDLNALEAGEAGQLHQLITDLAKVLQIVPAPPASYAHEISAVHRLAAAADLDGSPSDARGVRPNPSVDAVDLSSEARKILLEALNDPDPSILCIRSGQGMDVQVNQVELTTDANARTRTRWVSAVRELERLGLIVDMGSKGEAFELSAEGWDVADRLENERGI